MTSEQVRDAIREELSSVEAILFRKNESYGNSALEPVRVFSKADALAGIEARIDDKLSRIKNSDVDDEDTSLDLIGYLILWRIAKRGIVK